MDAPFIFTGPSGDDVNDVFPAAETGWKAAMVAATIAERDRSVLAYRVAPPVSVSAGAENYLHGVMRTRSDTPIGADYLATSPVAAGEAERQAVSNVDELVSVIGSQAITDRQVRVLPVGPGGDVALDIRLRVTDLSVLQRHLGDVVVGLASGLLGEGPQAISGLAISVVDDSGHRAGWWRAPSAGAAFGLWSPKLSPPPVLEPTRKFPNLIGGPSPQRAISGHALGESGAGS